jgi:LDH2 family malate/lactate/ureidoglycolate dehydrogenase
MTDMLVSLETLEAWTVRVLERAGASSEAAVATAKALVDANRRGVDSHGVVQLYFYLPGLRAGTTRGDAEPSIEVDLPAAALVDGHDGLGPYIAGFAMDLCCTKARSAGAAAVGVRNSSHFGASSVYAEQATRKGCFGLVFTNSDPGMSPLGALGPILGTNPIALAAPNGSRPPVSLDIATSVVAQGKVVLAEREGRTIPAGWAIGPDGAGTTDPAAALAGAMLPMGGHKGFGLAVMIDILSACLTGSALSPDISNDPVNPAPQRTGHLFIAISVDALADSGQYLSSLDRLASVVHSADRAPGTPEFLLPGEKEARQATRRKEGVPLDDASAALLATLGAEYGASFPA